MIEFTYIVDGKVMCGWEKPPVRLPPFTTTDPFAGGRDNQDLIEWEAGLLPVVNEDWVECEHPITGRLYKQPIIVIFSESFPINSGQKVETRETPEGKEITKILWRDVTY